MDILFKLTLVIVGQPGRQCTVAPPVLGGGAVAWWEGRAEKSALQVLLEQLAGDAGLACRDQVQVSRVTVLLHAVGGQWPRIGAQALTDYPALHTGVKTVLEKHLAVKSVGS